MPNIRQLNPSLRRAQRGLSLTELLAVIAILGITATLIFSVYAKAKERAKQPPCVSNLRQLGLAVEMYRSDTEGVYPSTLANLVATHPEVKVVLVCPADTGKGANEQDTQRTKTKTSVFYWSPYPVGVREALEAADANHGIAYCVLHGRRLPPIHEPVTVMDTTGLVVRLLADGSVRTVNVGFHCGQMEGGVTLETRTEWSLLTDARCPKGEFCGMATEPCKDSRELAK